MRGLLAAIGIWALFLHAATTADAAERELSARLDAILATAGYEAADWGLLVVDRRSGAVLYQRAADRLFAPADVAQLYTAAAALKAFGLEHRYQTPVHRRGEVDAEGRLDGDLILVAVGDPCLGGRTSPKDGMLLYRDIDHIDAGLMLGAALVEADPLAGLDSLAREVKAAGIVAVAGEVVIDDRLFEATATAGPGPSKVSPIMVNDNLIDVVVTAAAEPGKPAEVRTVPPSSYYAADVRVETGAEGSSPAVVVRGEGPRRFSVRGTVPVGHPPVVRTVEVDDPSSFARALLIERLRAHGVRVDASALGRNPADRLPATSAVAALPKVAQYTSPPWREYLKVALKTGHDAHAQALPLVIAASKGGRTLADGLRREGELLAGFGLPPGGYSLGSGSGESTADLASPRATVALLRAIDALPEATAFEAALPVLGRDGTAVDHVAADRPVRGHARAQAGTAWTVDASSGRPLLLSKSLAGYMETASGRDLAFAFFVNRVPTGPADRQVTSLAAARLLGDLCAVVYDDQAAPDRAAAAAPRPAAASGTR